MAHVSRSKFLPLLISAGILTITSGSAARAEGGAIRESGAPLAVVDLPVPRAHRLEAPSSLELMLLVRVNARERGVFSVRQAGGDFWVDGAAFTQLGIKAPHGGTGPVSLKGLTGVIVNYTEADQTLELVVPPTMLAGGMAHLNQAAPETPPADTASGLVLNYDVTANADRSSVDLGLLTTLRAFAPAGVIESTQVSRWRSGVGGGFDTIRLDTSFTHAFPDRRLSLQVGDIVTSGTAWSRPTRLGGLRFGTDFSLQPYFETTPQRRFEGTATLPSRVEMFVNGMRRYSGDLEPGRYDIGLGPGRIDGAGQATVVITDLLGRVTTQQFALYDSARLLRRGLDDWSAEIGMARLDYGLRSFAYSPRPALSMTWRRGVRDWLTLETHAEGRTDFGNVGIGGAVSLGWAGVATASVAYSRNGSASGKRVTLGYGWQGYGFHLSGEIRRSFGSFMDLGSDRFSLSPPDSAFVQAGYSDRRLGAFGLSYTSLRPVGEAPYRYAQLNWSRRIGRNASLRLSYDRDFQDSRRSAVRVSVQITPSRHTSGSAGYEFRDGGGAYDVSLQHSPPLTGGLGWRADLRRTDSGVLGMAQVDMLTDKGVASAAIRSIYGRVAAYGAYSGGLALMDGKLFAARRIDDSFAVVSTGGIANIPVSVGNEQVGSTDRHGLLLVTRLNSWQKNQVGIDTRDLPPSVTVDRDSAVAVPSDRAGTRVRFEMREFRALMLKAVAADGTPLPAGISVEVPGTGRPPVTLGFDGLLYLENPPDVVRLLAHTPTGACEIVARYQPAEGGIAQLGEHVCRPSEPTMIPERAAGPLESALRKEHS